MNRLKRALTVMKFELRRSLTMPRLAVWSVLALFPPAIVLLICVGGAMLPDYVLALIFVWLIPQVICLLALLLWVSPAVHTELEGKTWGYLAVRPDGRSALLFGKYLTGVIWATLACLVGLTLAVSVAVGFERLRNPVQFWVIFAVLVLLASFGYGAVFSLVGALFHRRAMVISVTYSIFSEFVLTNIPGAVIVKQFTFSFHFKNLLFAWRDFNLPTTELNEFFLDNAPPLQHLAIMIALTVVLLFFANFAVTHREYITADES
ncbi:MAG: hypothetical protein IH991_23410 [Planctomycetes bacterium]|nr:hypothetical protein [Planctomycetota bacterium]